jgi:curli biogenesis system outer membrane secretion channel CsgG
MKHIFVLKFTFFVCLLSLAGCASVTVKDRPDPVSGPTYSPKLSTAQNKPVTAVLPLALGLTPQLVKQYPHLVEKAVGLGVYQLVLSAVSDSNHFSVLEIRPENVDAILRERWLQQSGLMAAGEVAAIGRRMGARQVIYGRVFDYAETVSEKIVGFKAQQTLSKMVGVQLICTDISTLQQMGLGTATGYGDTIISATRAAISDAMKTLIDRMPPSRN